MNISKKAIIFIFLLLQTFNLIANKYWHNENILKKTIVLKSPHTTGIGEKIYITGDFEYYSPIENKKENCNWKEKCLSMDIDQTSEYLFKKEIFFLKDPNKREVNFKITRGSWDTELSDYQYRPLENLKISMDDPNEIFLINGIEWKDNVNHFSNFLINEETIPFNGIEDYAEISVLLPNNYYKNENRRYKTIYVFDGATIFNKPSPLSNASLDLHKIIPNNRIQHFQDVIIVAIQQKDNRYFAYNPMTEKGKKMMEFVAFLALNVIDKQFRTENDRSSRFLLGMSYGARIAIGTLIKYSTIFSKSALISPALPNLDYFKIWLRESFRLVSKDLSIYMDYGNHEWLSDNDFCQSNNNKEWQMLFSRYENDFSELAEFLRMLTNTHKSKCTVSVRNNFSYASHNESDWARRTNYHLKYFLNDF